MKFIFSTHIFNVITFVMKIVDRRLTVRFCHFSKRLFTEEILQVKKRRNCQSQLRERKREFFGFIPTPESTWQSTWKSTWKNQLLMPKARGGDESVKWFDTC
jgi:hypothetical protein